MPGGAFSSLYSFSGPDGCFPNNLVLGPDGSLYGTYGTIYKVNAAGQISVIHAFDDLDGAFATGGLVIANDGNLYGTTFQGGNYAYGNIFRVTPSGAFVSLFSFARPNIDGYQPAATLLQATDGDFYGTTSAGGSDNMGVVFRLSMGLPRLVKALPYEVAATFNVLSPSQIATRVPAGAATGYIQVTTPTGTLTSSGPFYVQ